MNLALHVTSYYVNSLGIVNMVNIIRFSVAQNVHSSVAQAPLIPISLPHQASSIKCSHIIWTWPRLAKQWCDGGVISAKITLNWGQRAEWKPQAISFIHIKLGKVAKCAKLIRLISFFLWLSACACPPFGRDIDLCRIITFPGTVGILIIWLQWHN